MKKETNITEFNKDAKIKGRYVYTDFKEYSCYRATKRQTDELLKILINETSDSSKILDVGCGDGTFTIQILTKLKTRSIVGFDSAKNAIGIAKKNTPEKMKGRIKFLTGNVYDSHKMFEKESFDLIIIRGVLHHLYYPEKAIRSLSLISKKIIVIEPNGYNPLLKIIERVSRYHIIHEEKSYWPPTLNSWFDKNGFEVQEQKYFGIVPYFITKNLAKTLVLFEPFIESIPFLRVLLCGTNLVYYRKK